MDTRGWVLTTHLVTMVWQNLDRNFKGNKQRSFNYRTFTHLIKQAAAAFKISPEILVLFILTVEDDKSRFESCWA
eukprot:7208398-Alexandrium_andersonii.AAC.1